MADYRAAAVLPRPHQNRRAGGGLDLPSVIRLAENLASSAGSPVHCGISLTPSGRAPQTVAATDDLPVRLDWLQHQVRQGPAIPPSAPSRLIASRDLAADRRWPDFGRLCVAVTGVRTMIAIPIQLSGAGRAMLSFYADEPVRLSRFPMSSAVTLAGQSASALSRLLRQIRSLLLAGAGDYNHTAVAVNHLMHRHQLTSAGAFALLDRFARANRLDLPALAIVVSRSGELPATVPGVLGRRAARNVGGPSMWRVPPRA